MEVKQGYKKTEIGIIPEDWDVMLLEDICVPSGLVRGPFGSSLKKEYFVKSGYKVYEQRNAIYKNVNIGNYYINQAKFDELIRFAIKQGDFIVSCSGTIGMIFQIPQKYKPGIINQALLKITIDRNKILDGYFENYFKWDMFQDRIIDSTQGGAIKNLVGMDTFKNTLLPVPSILEQQAIATALSDVDELISSLTRLIEKKKNIKQGTMQELLTGKKRLPGFTGEWKKTTIGKIGNLTGAGVDKKIIKGQKSVILLNYLDVYRRVFIERKMLNHEVTSTEDKIKSCSVQKGDIFFTPTSETSDDIAKSAVAIEDMEGVVYSYHVLRLRPDKSFNSIFLNYAFMSNYFEKQANTFSEGSGTRYVITLKKFRELFIIIPKNIDEQTAIANILSDMDEEIEKLEQKLNKYKAIKQGMMQELLTGRIRLI